jgi:hypothetical protein
MVTPTKIEVILMVFHYYLKQFFVDSLSMINIPHKRSNDTCTIENNNLQVSISIKKIDHAVVINNISIFFNVDHD